MRPLGYYDGKILEIDEAVISLEDRGYQFGDGIYEATKVYNGHCFALNRHLDRCIRSMRELKIPMVYTFEELEGLHYDLIRESGIDQGVVYFQITRGTSPRNHIFPEKVIPCLSMTIRPSDVPVTMQTTGISCIFAEDIRWHRCDIKSLNLLGNIMAKQQAHEAGCKEAFLVRKDTNRVTEGGSSNVFVIKDGVVWTHPINNFILKGVTRSILLEEILPKFDIPVLEKAFTPEFAAAAEEAFTTNTSFEIMPVIKLDRKPIGNGKPGEITLKLLNEYKELVKKECCE